MEAAGERVEGWVSGPEAVCISGCVQRVDGGYLRAVHGVESLYDRRCSRYARRAIHSQRMECYQAISAIEGSPGSCTQRSTGRSPADMSTYEAELTPMPERSIRELSSWREDSRLILTSDHSHTLNAQLTAEI